MHHQSLFSSIFFLKFFQRETNNRFLLLSDYCLHHCNYCSTIFLISTFFIFNLFMFWHAIIHLTPENALLVHSINWTHHIVKVLVGKTEKNKLWFINLALKRATSPTKCPGYVYLVSVLRDKVYVIWLITMRPVFLGLTSINWIE